MARSRVVVSKLFFCNSRRKMAIIMPVLKMHHRAPSMSRKPVRQIGSNQAPRLGPVSKSTSAAPGSWQAATYRNTKCKKYHSIALSLEKQKVRTSVRGQPLTRGFVTYEL